jgi:7,8-dihydropterin-6-yl-methyl-4-(beta-D-ribofuranosyl)aminobenzene 5'-phosphate synthase
MTGYLKEVDAVEVLTLQDNYIDIAAYDGNDIVKRALSHQDREIKNSILAEHGFSAALNVGKDDTSRCILFDFGFSEHGAASNADALGVDLGSVEAMVLSHGHMDHFGGLVSLARRVGKSGMELVLHPAALRKARHIKSKEGSILNLPALTTERLEEAGVCVAETKEPRILLGGLLLFLGEIPRKTVFERGSPRMFYTEGGQEKWDPIEDDSAVVANLRGKGLVILSGCAHAGIINTIQYAQQVTGVEQVYLVMGGFHLTGIDFEPIIRPTVEALKNLDPAYVVPAHCTGRKAVMQIEQELPDKFLLNMSGTKMVFKA